MKMGTLKSLFVAAVLLLLSSACTREESGIGYLEYKNETDLACTVRVFGGIGKDELFSIQIPAGETGIYYGEIYYMGSFVLGRYGNASVGFSDGSRIEYTKGNGGVTYDGKVGNLLLEVNYLVQEVDGKVRLQTRITEEMHSVAMEP